MPSQLPSLLRRGRQLLDVALLNVSPPDHNGFCSLGISVDATRVVMTLAGKLIAQVNKKMPRVFGDGVIHQSHFHAMTEGAGAGEEGNGAVTVGVRTVDEDLIVFDPPEHPTDDKIGEIIASNLVDDGATIQIGVGGLPQAVLRRLNLHKNIGVHTEVFSDGVMDLYERGVITNALKNHKPGYIVSCARAAAVRKCARTGVR